MILLIIIYSLHVGILNELFTFHFFLLEWSRKMKAATLQASSAIGHIIKLGPKILYGRDD